MPHPASYRRLGAAAVFCGLVLAACGRTQALEKKPASPPATQASAAVLASTPPTPAATPAPTSRAAQLIASARARVHTGEKYDPAYFKISYPGGDVPADRGVCTDVVIRAYRTLGVDLQQLVHEDMRANFAAYPKKWGLKAPDTNIDHRRVPNLQTFFTRRKAALPVSQNPANYRAGDLVTWTLPGNLPHIGIVSDRMAKGTQRPLILHNIGVGSVEEDVLLAWPITGHYRYYPHGN